jgi:hypothetical protein
MGEAGGSSGRTTLDGLGFEMERRARECGVRGYPAGVSCVAPARHSTQTRRGGCIESGQAAVGVLGQRELVTDEVDLAGGDVVLRGGG